MSDELVFTAAKDRLKPITFTLDGKEYTFKPSKISGVVLSAIRGSEGTASVAAFDWLDKGLGEDQAAELEARLRDPDDDLDIPDVALVIRGLIEKVSGRPTR